MQTYLIVPDFKYWAGRPIRTETSVCESFRTGQRRRGRWWPACRRRRCERVRRRRIQRRRRRQGQRTRSSRWNSPARRARHDRRKTLAADFGNHILVRTPPAISNPELLVRQPCGRAGRAGRQSVCGWRCRVAPSRGHGHVRPHVRENGEWPGARGPVVSGADQGNNTAIIAAMPRQAPMDRLCTPPSA